MTIGSCLFNKGNLNMFAPPQKQTSRDLGGRECCGSLDQHSGVMADYHICATNLPLIENDQDVNKTSHVQVTMLEYSSIVLSTNVSQ